MNRSFQRTSILILLFTSYDTINVSEQRHHDAADAAATRDTTSGLNRICSIRTVTLKLHSNMMGSPVPGFPLVRVWAARILPNNLQSSGGRVQRPEQWS